MRIKLCCFISLLLLVNAAMYGQNKVALVIGNSEYRGDYVPLKNPSNDARTMREVFERLGFETTVLINGNKETMERCIEDFEKNMNNADVAVFYFSGHGHYYSDYFLIPIGTDIKKEDDISSSSISLKKIADVFRRGARLSFFFIDACRNGDSDDNQIGGKSRSLISTEGVHIPFAYNAESGQVICYSTTDGKKAYDGKGSLSPFTKALSERLFDKSRFSATWSNIIKDVDKATNGMQIPSMEKDNYTGNYYFNKDGSGIPLNKKAVKFVVDPSISSIMLTNGKPKENIKISSGETKILNVGESYNYKVECDGYIPSEGKFDIKGNRAETLQIYKVKP